MIKQIALHEAELFADIISYEHNIYLRFLKLTRLRDKILEKDNRDCKEADLQLKYQSQSLSSINNQLDLLFALREIKNETSSSLRYLMYYRLLELLSKHYKGNVDLFLKNNNVSTQFIKDKRNPKRVKSLITHYRNKIHATTDGFSFPTSLLDHYLPEIETVVRLVSKGIINQKLLLTS